MKVRPVVGTETCATYSPLGRFGVGMRASSFAATGSSRDVGISAFGNGSLFNGSIGLEPMVFEKSPARSAVVGGYAEETTLCAMLFRPWKVPKKKTLFRRMGPPMVPPYWL